MTTALRASQPVLERFWAKVQVQPNGCWEWKGTILAGGYGQFWVNGRVIGPHRFAYEEFIGPIPEGKELDHLCRNRKCVNPTHLEAVTGGENTRRGLTGKINNPNAARTHCPQGHPYTEENTYIRPQGWRECRTCHKEQNRAYRRRV